MIPITFPFISLPTKALFFDFERIIAASKTYAVFGSNKVRHADAPTLISGISTEKIFRGF